MRKPVIGISTHLEVMDREPFLGQERSCLHQSYTQSIIKAGGVPYLLPSHTNPEIIRLQIDALDGVLFSGGYDIQPLLYHEEPYPFLEQVCPGRDQFEMQALKVAYELKKPIFGVCRGMQLMNVTFGGTLYQDIFHQNSERQLVQHSQKGRMHLAVHTVDVVPSTQLHQIFGSSTLTTNSSHHQGVKQLAPGFMINARARDGIVEGIEKPDYPFLLGVQWHPERMVEHYPEMLKLFQAFIAAAAAYRSRLG